MLKLVGVLFRTGMFFTRYFVIFAESVCILMSTIVANLEKCAHSHKVYARKSTITSIFSCKKILFIS